MRLAEEEVNSLKQENESNLKIVLELKKSNVSYDNEKEKISKELSQTKNELKNLQVTYKTLNRKLGQTINEKDTQISQLQQSLFRKLFKI